VEDTLADANIPVVGKGKVAAAGMWSRFEIATTGSVTSSIAGAVPATRPYTTRASTPSPSAKERQPARFSDVDGVASSSERV
jgi:hypothetical protein